MIQSMDVGRFGPVVGAGDGGSNVGFCSGASLQQVFSPSDARGDGSGKRAAGSMGVDGINARHAEGLGHWTVTEHVYCGGIFVEVASFEKHGALIGLDKVAGRL